MDVMLVCIILIISQKIMKYEYICWRPMSGSGQSKIRLGGSQIGLNPTLDANIYIAFVLALLSFLRITE
jgi:hypothetical protein